MKYHQLTREQRYAIYLGLQAGDSISAIARRIEVNKSTVSRELSRNKNRFGKYGWHIADEKANKLVRQYIPKGTDFRELTDEFITAVQYRLSRRPRKKLNFSTPKDEFFNLLE